MKKKKGKKKCNLVPWSSSAAAAAASAWAPAWAAAWASAAHYKNERKKML